MKLFVRALLITIPACGAAALAIMWGHGLPVFDAACATAIVAAFGALPAVRAASGRNLSDEEKALLVTKFALFLPVVMFALHAIVWTASRYQDTGVLLPQSARHWLSVIAATVTLVAWLGYFHLLERNRAKAAQRGEASRRDRAKGDHRPTMASRR